jgi:Leucine-rich repeat (LRR) protein
MRIVFLLFLLSSSTVFGQNIRTLYLSNCDTIPDNLYNRKYLTTLRIENSMGYCHSPVKVLSAKITNLKSLESLTYESSDKFATLPPEVNELKNLTYLATSDVIPEIGEITSLKTLSLTVYTDTDLKDLKELSFKNLVNLEYLYIRFNGRLDQLESAQIFKDIDALVSLKHFEVFNASNEILAQITNLKNLESIAINGLKGQLELDFSAFPNLNALAITRVEGMDKFPKSIYTLSQLTDLSITNTDLTEIPDGISALKQLQNLNLTFNKITYLANDFVDLKNLETLSLVRNFNLKTLPEDIGKLTNLKRLAVQSCQLSELPASLMDLTNLEALVFNVNDVVALPEDWSKLKKLKVLNAERNKLETLPASLFALENLEVLQLGRNCLLGDIFMNQQLPIGGLISLKQLDFQYNDLLVLPYDIGKLKNLEDLNIYKNNLLKLPESIGGIGKLSSLSMSENQISSLPKSMKKIRIYEFSAHSNAFENLDSLKMNFPKAKRIWIDEKFENDLPFWPKLGREIYFR